MSRTFDVLERIQEDRDLFRVPPITKAMPIGVGAPDGRSSRPDVALFAREEILRLVQHLFLATENITGTSRRQVVFCGIDNSDGSNLLCARIGRILAEQVQSQVCVVDANVRVPSSSPLVDLLPFDDPTESEGGSTKGASRRVTENLWLASGDSACKNATSPTLDEVKTWISSLPPEFAHVVISASPAGLYADAVLLGQTADGVVLVLEANSTRWQAALKAKQVLEDAKVRVLGTVLNNRTFPIPEKIYRLL
jgi:protein-tyrosine kinase